MLPTNRARLSLRILVSLATLLAVVAGQVGTASAASSHRSIAVAKRFTIASIIPTFQNPFWTHYAQFQKIAARQLGFNLKLIDGQNAGASMLTAAESAITAHVSALIYVPYFSTGTAVLIRAQAAHIPVAMVDTSVPGSLPQGKYKNYVSFIGPDDAKAGYDEAVALFRGMKPAKDGKKHIIALEGTLGTSVNSGRVQGLQRAIKQQAGKVVLDGMQTANFLTDTAVSVTSDLLLAHPGVGGIWTANDEMSVGAITALSRVHKVAGKDVMVTGLNADPIILPYIARGQVLISPGGHWLEGGFATGILFDFLNGHKVPKSKSILRLPLVGITKSNLATFKKLYPGDQPKNYNFRLHSQTYTKGVPPADYTLKLRM